MEFFSVAQIVLKKVVSTNFDLSFLLEFLFESTGCNVILISDTWQLIFGNVRFVLWPLLIFGRPALWSFLFTADSIRIRFILLWSCIHEWIIHSLSSTLTASLLYVGISLSLLLLFLPSHSVTVMSRWLLRWRLLFLLICNFDWSAIIAYHICPILCSF